jgi:hypothetical protein
LTTGQATFQGKSHEELLKLQMEIQNKDSRLKQLEINHRRILQKREYHKFQKGPCFYIIHVKDNHFKIGYDGVDINERFRTYRTSIPMMKVCHMVFSPEASLIEKCMLLRFKDYLVENNHEFLSTISLLELITSIDTLVKYCKIPYTVVCGDEITKYNTT